MQFRLFSLFVLLWGNARYLSDVMKGGDQLWKMLGWQLKILEREIPSLEFLMAMEVNKSAVLFQRTLKECF